MLRKIAEQDLVNSVSDSTKGIAWYKIAVDICTYWFLYEVTTLNVQKALVL